jgi:hypothetical protein
MGNVHNYDCYINIPSLQTYRSLNKYLLEITILLVVRKANQMQNIVSVFYTEGMVVTNICTA